MQYKYKKLIEVGPFGKIVSHVSSEENEVLTLGQIGDYTYISALSIEGQPTQLSFEEITLTDEEKTELLSQKYMQVAKQSARTKIRQVKDFEDDLTDLKKVVQFMARGFAGLWDSLPQELKDANQYKDNFNLFSQAIENTEFRLDLEKEQVVKISKILQDEAEFATIVKDEYLSRI